VGYCGADESNEDVHERTALLKLEPGMISRAQSSITPCQFAGTRSAAEGTAAEVEDVPGGSDHCANVGT
jgi:hypothetical protein